MEEILKMMQVFTQNIVDINEMFDIRLKLLREKCSKEEFRQREEELNYLRTAINDILKNSL